MKKQLLILGIVLSAATLGLLYELAYKEKDAMDRVSVSERERIEVARIKEYGGARAYEMLSEDIADFSPQQQHTRAHAFGAALYTVEGTQGLSVCDARYSFGCFHEFLGRAITDLGLGSVNDLNDRCFSALTTSPLSCQHGIGHGILANLGYTKKDLDQALAICRDLPRTDPIGGCYAGVFMEYNMRTMLGERSETRPIGTEGLHGPCASFDMDYRIPCYYWQSQWWHQVLRSTLHTEDEIFGEIGALCVESADQALIRSCFEGVGTIAPSSAEFDPARTAELCEIAADTLRNKLFCLSIAANSLFVSGARNAKDAPHICSSLQGEALKYCLSYASNSSNILNKRTVPESLGI